MPAFACLWQGHPGQGWAVGPAGWHAASMTERLTLCALVWARPGQEERLLEYERQVLALLPEHGARVVHRAVSVDREPTQPLEVQLLEFPSQAAFDAYLEDPKRRLLADLRDTFIERTSVFPVDLGDVVIG